MKRPIEKILLILNSLIGLVFVGSVVISKIPLLKLNILDKYLNYSFLKGGILIIAFILAAAYLALSIVLIVNRMRFTNNSIYVYGESSIDVTSHNIRKVAKSVCKEIEGIKSVNIDIQLGEFGNCLLINTKVYEGYDFQSLVGKLRPKLEEAITMNLGIKFPSYKFADGKVLFEFGAPYAGIGIDLEAGIEKEISMPATVKTLEPVKKTEETIEKAYIEPFNAETDEIQKDNIFPEVDFEPQELSMFETQYEKEEPALTPDQYSIPYTTPNRGMPSSSFEKKEEKRAEYADPFNTANAIPSTKSYSQFKSYEKAETAPKQNSYDNINRDTQKPLQTAYDSINKELQKQTSIQQQAMSQNSKEQVRPENQNQFNPNARQGFHQSPNPVQSQKPVVNRPNNPVMQNPNQAQRPRPQGSVPSPNTGFQTQTPYPQRPTSMSVRPTPQNANSAMNQNNNLSSSQVNQSYNNTPRRPQETQRPAQQKVSKEDVYARINAILNKYSKSDDDNNK